MKRINPLLFIAAIAVFTIGSYVYYHEQAHVQICEYYGGNSTVSYGLAGAYAHCTIPTGADTRLKWFADGINEAIGYQTLIASIPGFAAVCMIAFNGREQ